MTHLNTTMKHSRSRLTKTLLSCTSPYFAQILWNSSTAGLPTDFKSVVTPSSMKGRIVSDHNPNDRVYVRVPKPLNDMTPEEIDEFAEETYEQIMKLMRGGKDTDAK